MTAAVRGCHLVGSTGYPDTETSIRKTLAGSPSRLKRVPDGETGARFYFTGFQWELFKTVPGMAASFEPNKSGVKKALTEEEVDEGIQKLKDSKIETGYDSAAIESYAVFKRLKEEGVIPQGVRFQVGLPTVASVVSPFVEQDFQPKVWPIYEEALFRAMKNMQAQIPHPDLAIQIDLAVDTAFWEGVYLTPWFKDQFAVREYVADYIVRMIEHVEQDVELGLHNCYGDMNHKHWYEPTSLRAVVDRGILLIDKSPHPINYFHAPVPVSASDNLDSFLAPLVDLVPKLKEHKTELYLGVVQYNDPEGTKKRIEAAKTYVPEFGVATECGWGRTPPEQVDDIMRLTSEVCEPVL